MRRVLFIGAVVLFSSLSSFSAHFEITSAGKPVDDAEVCLVRTTQSRDPMARYFGQPEVNCHPAAGDVAVPNGEWNAFARRGNSLVSDHVEPLSAAARLIHLEVVPAATVRPPELAKEAALFAYIPRTQSALPVRDNVVPADTLLLPVIVTGGKVTGTGEPLTVAARSSASIDIARIAEKRADVLIAVIVRTVPQEKSEAPVVSLTTSGKSEKNILPIRGARNGETALALFRGVPAGPSTIAATGTRWKSADVKIDPKGGFFAAEKPVVIDAASRLTVHWWTPVDPATLRVDGGDCDSAPIAFPSAPLSTVKTPKATLLLCPERDSNLRDCSESASRDLPLNAIKGDVQFENVPAGSHWIAFDFPGLPSVGQEIEASTKASSEANVEFKWVSFFGRVTRGGKPVHARIFDTVTDPATGRYTAAFTRMPGRNVQFVAPCDRKFSPYRFVPDQPPVENAAFDVEIPENEISIDVVDKKSGAAVQGASISLAAADPDDATKRAMAFAGAADGPNKTDENGHVTIGPVLTNRELMICASHDDYLRGCAERFTMKESSKSLRIELEKSLKLRGRVVAGVPLDGGFPMLVWFSPAGEPLEMVRKIAADGSFFYTKVHSEGEMVAFISQVTPFYVFMQPRIDEGGIFEIAIPAARVRTFSVSIAPGSSLRGTIGLKIGDLFVSANALAWHLGPRLHVANRQIGPGGTQQIVDILETGPISAIVIPPILLPRPPGASYDAIFGPERNSFARKPLGEDNVIVFE